MDGQRYRGEITLGFSTETEDADGAPVERKRTWSASGWGRILLDAAMATPWAKLSVIPPHYSAAAGKRLYEYARAEAAHEKRTKTRCA